VVRDKNDPTKRGINNTFDYILHCCDESLGRLGIDYIDLYYLHRINEKHDVEGSAPLEESMRAFAALFKQGKIHHVGISEARARGIIKVHKRHARAYRSADRIFFTEQIFRNEWGFGNLPRTEYWFCCV
jgi:aryl-alcohol dehydrogenase-like predicted oxidoreductase